MMLLVGKQILKWSVNIYGIYVMNYRMKFNFYRFFKSFTLSPAIIRSSIGAALETPVVGSWSKAHKVKNTDFIFVVSFRKFLNLFCFVAGDGYKGSEDLGALQI
jgi:hypothetical protein